MTSSLLPHHELLERTVVSRLKEIHNITVSSGGCIAGGAVANTILSIVDGGDAYPINDLDFYISEDGNCDRSYMPRRFSHYTSRAEETDEGYPTHLRITAKAGYQVVSAGRDGMANNIIIRRYADTPENGPGFAHAIMDGFDLNCCGAAVDLLSHKLYLTADFREFIATRKLKTTAVYTPFHTAIRLAKKQEDLKCDLDLAREISMLATYVDVCSEIPVWKGDKDTTHYATYFGKRYRQKYEKYNAQLYPYTKLERFDNSLLNPGGHVVSGVQNISATSRLLSSFLQLLSKPKPVIKPKDMGHEFWMMRLSGSEKNDFFKEADYQREALIVSRVFCSQYDEKFRI